MTAEPLTGTLLRLRPNEFRLLRDLVNAHAGLHFDDEALVLFDRRLADRLATLQLSGYDEYYKYLRFNVRGQSELDEVLERVTTNETYFFRQEYQLRAFKNEILPRVCESNSARRRLAVWSAGCSTGEEVYTLAMLIHESELFEGWDVRVIGSDICKQNVTFARRGIYRGSAFRTTPLEYRRSYFIEADDGFHVADKIRKMCYFGQLNLLDTGKAAIVGRADVVVCRNVLIYLDVRSRRKVIDSLYERLVPGGILLLGHSESLLNVTTAFELVHLSEDLVYRKPHSQERLDPGAR
jgi:chemotaxis protein methyltransferase CheR